MKLFSFLGETPTVALRNAQLECGEDAIVVSTKKISDGRDGQKQMYEVTVTIEEELAKDDRSEKSVNYSTHTIKSEPMNRFDNDSAKVYSFTTEVLKMQEAIEQVKKTLWSPKSQLYDLNIPPEFIDIYALFEQNEFDQEMTYTILKKTIQQLPLVLKSDTKKINNFFRLILRRIIPIKYEVPLRENQRKIMMFVGPTGVGKTTTIAKLAARYAYKLSQENNQVGVITLDSFRVGAIEQLKAYVNIMRLPFEVVKKPDDLVDALIRLKSCNYILIDTAGCSQYDIDKIELLNEFQMKVNMMPIEKVLVLPTNVKQNDLMEIYNNYGRLSIDYLLFTKLDETKSFGSIISFAYKIKKSIIYLSIGQNVPDDLIVGDENYLIDCFMNQTILNQE